MATSTQEDVKLDTNTFYRRTLHVLNDAKVPFLVGGSHALLHYTGIVRNTKDLDLFVKHDDMPAALQALGDAGYRTEMAYPHWLGKAHYGENFIDLVFNSGNGVAVVDQEWFDHAVEADVLGLPVKLQPAEEFIWQKAYIMERERYDGADIMHVILRRGAQIDWDRLLRRFEPHWRLLLSYLVFFRFVYPCETDCVPESVMTQLLDRFRDGLGCEESHDRLCRGTLVSRKQFLIDVGRWGFRDARMAEGHMSAEDMVFWTWAIDHDE